MEVLLVVWVSFWKQRAATHKVVFSHEDTKAVDCVSEIINKTSKALMNVKGSEPRVTFQNC
jgi:hypothetical protein